MRCILDINFGKYLVYPTIILLITSVGMPAEQKSEVRMVKCSDIPENVQILGMLGHSLGEIVTVKGTWKTFEEKPAPPCFVVESVNGSPIDPARNFEKIEPISGKAGDVDKRNDGEKWELRGVETGGFSGFSDKVIKEIGQDGMDLPSRGFLTHFCYVKARRIAEGREPTVPNGGIATRRDAEAATKPAENLPERKTTLKLVSYEDISKTVQLVGKLGHPLGEIVTVRGTWRKANEKQRLRYFVVNSGPRPSSEPGPGF